MLANDWQYTDSSSYQPLLGQWASNSVPSVVEDSTGSGCRERIGILPGLEPILEHADHRRLRRVWQLGTVPVLCPQATHTRFEHSVSVSGLALNVLGYLDTNSAAELAACDLRPQHLAALQCAGLIHDLGHTPLSHAAEDYLYQSWAGLYPDLAPVLNHEALSDIIFGSMLDGDAFKAGPSHVVELWDDTKGLSKLAQAIAWGGKHGSAAAAGLSAECGWLATIVANRFHGADVDRCDYLLRDAIKCGHPRPVNYFDPLYRSCRLLGGKLSFHSSGAEVLRDMLIRRWDFNLQYYRASMVQAAGLQLMDALRAADTELHCYSDALRDLLGSEPDTAAFNRLMTQEGMCAPIREADPAAAGPSLQLAQHLLQRYDSRDYYREAVFEPLDDPTPAYGSASGSGGSGPGLGPPPMSPIAQGPENAAFMVQGGGGSGVDALEQGGTATAAAGGGGHASHSNGGTSQNGGRGGGGVHGRFHSPSHGGGMELCGRVPSPAALVCCQDHNLGCKFREEDLRIVVFDVRAATSIGGQLRSSLDLATFYDEADVTPAYGAGESSSSGRSSSSSSCGSASGTGKCTWRITPHAAHALLRPPLMQRYLRIFWAGDACSQAHHAQMCTAIQAAYRTWQRREAAMSTPKRQRMMGPSAHGGEHFMLAPDTQAKRGM